MWVNRGQLVRLVTSGKLEWLMLLVALLLGGLAWRLGAPRWVGLALALTAALLVRVMRQRGFIDHALARWLHPGDKRDGA